VAVNTSVSRSARSKILAHLRTLRANLSDARTALLHFKDDRLDRDRLEPAARRVDDLMNMFATDSRDPSRSSAWMAEIQSGIDGVTNVKSVAALCEAQVDLVALREAMEAEARPPS